MLPNFITDKTKIAKYAYADVEKVFLDNYENVLKNILPTAIPLKILKKIISVRFVNFFPCARITILNRCASKSLILFIP